MSFNVDFKPSCVIDRSPLETSCLGMAIQVYLFLLNSKLTFAFIQDNLQSSLLMFIGIFPF